MKPPLPIWFFAAALAAFGCEGPEGPPGPAGDEGPSGPGGAVGPEGPAGRLGEIGEVGPRGPVGPEGPLGPEGPGIYVPRPGLTVQITDAAVVSSTVTVTVRATDDRGEPIPFEELTRIRVTVARIVPANNNGDGDFWDSIVLCPAAAPNEATLQPCVENIVNNSALSAGAIENADRSITYSLSAPLPGDYDPSALHRVSVEARRTFDGVEVNRNVQYDFVPAGGAVPTREVVTTDACNGCHAALEAHGGGRNEIDTCVTCHTPQLVDPDTGENLLFTAMIHKIHRGAELPSVLGGQPYVIVGFRGSVHDYSAVRFPQDIRTCGTCHQGADASRHNMLPARNSCATCHDRTWFGLLADMPAGYVAHVGGPMADDSVCGGCHPPAAGIAGIDDRHRRPDQLPGAPTFHVEITDVTAAAGAVPVIEMTMSDRAGTPLDTPASVLRLAATAAGPTAEYTDLVRNTAIGGGSSGLFETLGGGLYRYTFGTALAATATGTWAFGVEGYRQGPLPAGGTFRYGTVNPVAFANVEGEAIVPRRQVVEDDKCAACHFELAVHGNNRIGNTQYCVTCHNPTATDAAQRTVGAPVTIDFKVLIHKIHRGADLPSVVDGTPYVVFGFGMTPHDYSEVRFPGVLDDCDSCHLEDTYERPSTAVCSSCHDDDATFAHAELNTTSSGVESCAVCHGPGREFEAH